MSDQDIRDLWDGQRELRAQNHQMMMVLTKIEEKLNGYVSKMEERCDTRSGVIASISARVTRNEERIDKLEQFKAQVLVLAALGATIGGAAVSFAFKLIGG